MNTLTDLAIGFRYPERLWLIAILAVLFTPLVFLAYRSARDAFTSNPILRLHVDGEGKQTVSSVAYMRAWAWGMALLALLSIVFAEPVRREERALPIWGGVRVTFLLDVSLSMKYAHDVAPYQDRLHAAKSVLADFADVILTDSELRGKYHLALIPFAGEAMTYLAFSKSREEFIEAIDNVDEGTVTATGTNMLNAVLEYERLWGTYPPKDKHTVDIVVMITDGGKGEGNRADIPAIKATLSRFPDTVSVFTVGVGSVKKTVHQNGRIDRRTVPVELFSQDASGRLLRYLFEVPGDPSSKRVTSELDEEVLTAIAGTRGKYFFYEGKQSLIASLKEVIVAKRKREGEQRHTTETDLSRAFLITAFLIAFFLFGYGGRMIRGS